MVLVAVALPIVRFCYKFDEFKINYKMSHRNWLILFSYDSFLLRLSIKFYISLKNLKVGKPGHNHDVDPIKPRLNFIEY